MTKSGGNEFHGDLFGYYDSYDLAVRRRPRPPTARPSARRQLIAPDALRLRRGPRRLLREGPPLVLRRVQPRVARPGLCPQHEHLLQPERHDRHDEGHGRLLDVDRHGRDAPVALLGQADVPPRRGPHALRVRLRRPRARSTAARSRRSAPTRASSGTRSNGGVDIAAKYDGIFGTSFLLSAQYSHHEEKNDNNSPYENTQGILLVRGGRTQIAPGAGPLTSSTRSTSATTSSSRAPSSRARTRSRSAASTRSSPRRSPRSTPAASRIRQG